MFIAAGVCTPQGVWIRAMERRGSLLTKTLKRTKAQQPEGHKRQGVLYVFVLYSHYPEFRKNEQNFKKNNKTLAYVRKKQ